MPKQARVNRIKSYRCYTLQEAAELVGVSKRTLRNWSKDGLQLFNCQRPVLVRGDDLRNYLLERRQSNRVKTELCEFFCLKCRDGRSAYGAMADCEITDNRAMLTALCGTCGTVMCKPVSLTHLPEIGRNLDLTIRGDGATL